ncbi:MAG: DUF2892 domain-containing protein [Myxococcaceae bacterium]|nr:DUF2892 domain-containing protein [Myxococcaceae bacterium]
MNLFPNNEHKVERIIRVIVGAGVLSLFFVGPQTPWALLGIVPLATGALGSCPLYTLFGISTCSVSKHQKTAT